MASDDIQSLIVIVDYSRMTYNDVVSFRDDPYVDINNKQSLTHNYTRCPVDRHYIFPAGSASGDPCPTCGWAYDAKKTVKIRMWHPDSRIINFMRSPTFLQAKEYATTRDHSTGWVEDVYDSELYNEYITEAKARGVGTAPHLHSLCFKWANDPCEFTVDGKSWTPVELVCMDLPPWLRTSVGAVLLAFLLPPGWKNLQILLPYFLARWVGPDGVGLGGRGVVVPPSSGFEYVRRVLLKILFTVNDTRAIPMVNCMLQAPARVRGHHLTC